MRKINENMSEKPDLFRNISSIIDLSQKHERESITVKYPHLYIFFLFLGP